MVSRFRIDPCLGWILFVTCVWCFCNAVVLYSLCNSWSDTYFVAYGRGQWEQSTLCVEISLHEVWELCSRFTGGKSHDRLGSRGSWGNFEAASCLLQVEWRLWILASNRWAVSNIRMAESTSSYSLDSMLALSYACSSCYSALKKTLTNVRNYRSPNLSVWANNMNQVKPIAGREPNPPKVMLFSNQWTAINGEDLLRRRPTTRSDSTGGFQHRKGYS